MKWKIDSYMQEKAYWYFWQESINGRCAEKEQEPPTVHLHVHVITAQICLAKKKDFAVWISILAVQMSLKSFWQIQFPLLRIEAMPLFSFFPPLVLLSKLIRLNPDGGIPGTPTFNCPTRLTHKEWKWALGAASDDEELWKGDEDGHSKFL